MYLYIYIHMYIHANVLPPQLVSTGRQISTQYDVFHQLVNIYVIVYNNWHFPNCYIMYIVIQQLEAKFLFEIGFNVYLRRGIE